MKYKRISILTIVIIFIKLEIKFDKFLKTLFLKKKIILKLLFF